MTAIVIISAMMIIFGLIALPTGLVLLLFKTKRPLGKKALLASLIGIIGIIAGFILGDYHDKEAREAGWLSATDKMDAKKAGFSDPNLWYGKVEADRVAAAAAKAEADRAAEAARVAKAQADQAGAAAKAQAEKTAAEQAEAQRRSKEAACRQDIQCWGDKHTIAAAITCDDYIERLAQYSFEWTDKWYEPKFSHFRWKNKAAGHVTYMGDKIKFQNGFGAFQFHVYSCDFDTTTGAVLNVSAKPGRL